jgi:hypothetical protein
MCRWAGATRAYCSDRSRSWRCIFVASRCLRRRGLRSHRPCSPFQPDGVRAVADRDVGYFRAGIRPVGDRSVHSRAFGNSDRSSGSLLPDWLSVFPSPAKWSGLFALAICIVIVTVIRLMQGWRIQFANGNADGWYGPGKARVGVAESALYAPGARLRCSIPIRSGSICF